MERGRQVYGIQERGQAYRIWGRETGLWDIGEGQVYRIWGKGAGL